MGTSATPKNITTLDRHLDKRYGTRGTATRTDFEIRAKAFMIEELLKEERRLQQMTQEKLAEKIGAKKCFISRIENGHADIQLSTLYRLFETGLGKSLQLVVR